MTPKVVFKYSWVYDKRIEEWGKVNRTWKYPSSKKTLSFIKRVTPLWQKHEKAVLQELSKITGLPWHEKTITAYVVGSCRPFSDPLTIGIRKDPTEFIDILTHECIHQLFTQGDNIKRWEKSWKYNTKKYQKESLVTMIHIPLHAIHEHIFRKFFGEKRLQRELEWYPELKDYVRAWDAVQKEGYKNVIEAMKERAARI